MAQPERYDRQLRIWGSHGQRCLQSSSICVIGAGPTNCEALKCLVLTGIKSFYLYDPEYPNYEDEIMVNYFLDSTGNQSTRSMSVIDSIAKLNESVEANVVSDFENISPIINGINVFIIDYGILFRLNIVDKVNNLLKDIEDHVSVVVNFCSGSVGILLTHFKPRIIFETHDNLAFSFALKYSFKLLDDLVDHLRDALEIDSDLTFNIPWPLLLAYYSRIHSGSIDVVRQELKKLYKAQPSAQNLYEALKNIHKLKEDDKLVENSTGSESCILVALKRFYSNHHRLPISTSNQTFPDMISSTSWYNALKRVYIEQEICDLREIITYPELKGLR
ncbi:hypothetical protein ACOME3_000677 [Neoechinorhynchus agilis]